MRLDNIDIHEDLISGERSVKVLGVADSQESAQAESAVVLQLLKRPPNTGIVRTSITRSYHHCPVRPGSIRWEVTVQEAIARKVRG